MNKINKAVFFPPIVLLIFTVLLSQLYGDAFVHYLSKSNAWILSNFDGLFSWTALLILLLVIVVYISPLGKLTIGGKEAQPFLTKWRWFAITICTTIATGILFWGVAEPVFHFSAPPDRLGIQPSSPEAMVFAMSSLMMHWTLTPYAIYTLGGLVFAIAFYNFSQPFHLGSMLFPLFGNKSAHPWLSNLINIICLYGLVAGMSASLGAGLLSLMGGLVELFGWQKSNLMLAIIACVIVLGFTISSASGLMKGIRILSDINIKGFLLLAVFILLMGPTVKLFDLGWQGITQYTVHFFPRSVNWQDQLGREWFGSWTVFNWANWMAWAPVTALFLGRLAKGYTVRQFIHFNLLIPSLFGGLWMIVFGGSALVMDAEQQGILTASLKNYGPESLIYVVLSDLPFSQWVSVLFVLLVFISYVTAADSNTSAMSAMSSHGITPDHGESPVIIKVVWGILIGMVSWVMVTSVGIEGIKIISILGGFPILFLMIAVSFSAIALIMQTNRR